jgi:hypothetical protein
MELDFTLIGIALATMFFGYFFGLVEGRGQGYKKRRKEEALEFKDLVQPTSSPPGQPVVKDDSGILRLKEQDQKLVLDLDGQRVTTGLLSPDQRKRMIAILTLMRPWLEGTSAAETVQAFRAQQPPGTPPAPVPVVRPDTAAKPAVPRESLEEDKPAPILSIVGQIDAILQQRLAASPLGSRGIRLQESPEGGVLVWVGVKKYQTVEDVPDPEIKALIRSAIREWEQKAVPGS